MLPLEPAAMFPFSVCRGFYRASAFPLARELFNVFVSGFMRQAYVGGLTLLYIANDSRYLLDVNIKLPYDYPPIFMSL